MGKAWVDVCGKAKGGCLLPACACEHHPGGVLPELPLLRKPCTENLVSVESFLCTSLVETKWIEVAYGLVPLFSDLLAQSKTVASCKVKFL